MIPSPGSLHRSGPASPTRVASIDIGTNTILLLIADWDGTRVRPLFEAETTVRLGGGLQGTRRLSREAMERGLQTLTVYTDRCRAMKVEKVFAVGTSALREANNTHEWASMIQDRLNLSIEVISEEEEALSSFLAVARDLEGTAGSLLVIDVGGGSSEFILGREENVEQWLSLPLGAVRVTEQFLRTDPPKETEWAEMTRAIREELVAIPHPNKPVDLVAVGGTATTLAAVEQSLETFAADQIHHFILTEEALNEQLLLYRTKSIEERRKIRGLPPARADVILAGAAVLDGAMKELRCDSLQVSCHGVRYGVLYRKLSPL